MAKVSTDRSQPPDRGRPVLRPGPTAALLATALAASTLAAAPAVEPTVDTASATTSTDGDTSPQGSGVDDVDEVGDVTDAQGDVTVIAIVDSSFSPYHFDMRADRMPQHLDDDPGNDLPLSGELAPHDWIPGFPDPAEAFAEYRALDLTLPEAGPVRFAFEADRAEWESVQPSTAATTNFYWAPGTKAVGMVDFRDGGFDLPGGASHGMGSASVAAGSIHGACPECVVVLLPYGSGDERESASNWAYDQPWIDVVTNSFGFSLLVRDRYYNGGNAELSRAASERGQTIFFSAGNGQANAFAVPNATLLSSQEGPDWMVTVGAIDPGNEGSYIGHGKPVDIASIGIGYPSAPSSGDVEVDSEGSFGGTSNSTPVTAGTYARALHLVRTALDGPSRTQDGGVVATGSASCDDALPDCALVDGELTAKELRDALFDTAVHTDAGFTPYTLGLGGPAAPTTDPETTYMTEGRGSLFGRVHDDEQWLAETGDIAALALGKREPTGSDADEDHWFAVDSWCRQQIWGSWEEGAWTSQVPPPTEPATPLAGAYAASCPALVAARP